MRIREEVGREKGRKRRGVENDNVVVSVSFAFLHWRWRGCCHRQHTTSLSHCSLALDREADYLFARVVTERRQAQIRG